MTARFFIGDLHFGHAKVSEIRGFESTLQHDTALITSWLHTVRDQDEVFVLGDLSSGSSQGEVEALDILRQLPGTKHLIAGNHDSVSSVHRSGWRKYDTFREVFDSVRDFGRIRAQGHDVLLSHYPYASQGDGPNREGVRYLQYRLPDLGAPLVHAHTHHTKPIDADPKQLCVSWDAWGRLVTQKDVDDWLRGLGG